MTEANLSKKMVQVLRSRGAWAVKTHGDPRQRRGQPDIIACYKGYFLGLEVKLPGKENTITKLQAATLVHMKDAGGVATVVTSIKHIRQICDHIDEVMERGHRRRAA